MKNKMIVAIMALLMAVAGCSRKSTEEFVIEGSIDGLESGIVFLQDRMDGLMITLDSAIVENGQFRFSGSVQEPFLAYLSGDGIASRIPFFIENSLIKIQLKEGDSGSTIISGSQSNDLLEVFNMANEVFELEKSEIHQMIIEAEIMGDTALSDQYREQFAQIEQTQRDHVMGFVQSYPDQAVTVHVATRQLSHEMDAMQLDELIGMFSKSLAGSRYYDALVARSRIMHSLLPGKPAPLFRQQTPEGDLLGVEDFRGKYLLISFWASWCPDCRVKNPHLVGIYEKYKSSGFEILGVSLDRAHDAWLRGIAQDKLSWPQVSDLGGWRNEAAQLYAVSWIPTEVLVDPQGIIIARGIKGDALDTWLKENLPATP